MEITADFRIWQSVKVCIHNVFTDCIFISMRHDVPWHFTISLLQAAEDVESGGEPSVALGAATPMLPPKTWSAQNCPVLSQVVAGKQQKRQKLWHCRASMHACRLWHPLTFMMRFSILTYPYYLFVENKPNNQSIYNMIHIVWSIRYHLLIYIICHKYHPT